MQKIFNVGNVKRYIFIILFWNVIFLFAIYVESNSTAKRKRSKRP